MTLAWSFLLFFWTGIKGMCTGSSFNVSSTEESGLAGWDRTTFSTWCKLVLRARSGWDTDFNLIQLASVSSFMWVGYSMVNRPVNRNAVVTFPNYQVTSALASWLVPTGPLKSTLVHTYGPLTGSCPVCLALHLAHCPSQQSAWKSTSHVYLFCMTQLQSYFSQMPCISLSSMFFIALNSEVRYTMCSLCWEYCLLRSLHWG